ALGDVERMMIWDRHHAGAETNAPGALCRRHQEHLRRRDGFPSAGMMLADPELVEVQLVEPRCKLQIALELEGGVLANRMVGRQEDAEPQALVHCKRLLIF